jgi:SMI1 / KNR4 family (SUKH-1)
MAGDWPPMEFRGPEVTEADIAAFEHWLGRTLPDDYRRFLIEVNGGRTDRQHCDFKLGVLNGLHSLCDPDDDSDLKEANHWIADLPSRDLLYVGYDGIGGRILIAIAGSHAGEVWLQDTEDPRPEGSNPRVLWHDRRDMQKLADSFEAFLRTLGPLKSAAQEG